MLREKRTASLIKSASLVRVRKYMALSAVSAVVSSLVATSSLSKGAFQNDIRGLESSALRGNGALERQSNSAMEPLRIKLHLSLGAEIM